MSLVRAIPLSLLIVALTPLVIFIVASGLAVIVFKLFGRGQEHGTLGVIFFLLFLIRVLWTVSVPSVLLGLGTSYLSVGAGYFVTVLATTFFAIVARRDLDRGMQTVGGFSTDSTAFFAIVVAVNMLLILIAVHRLNIFARL